MSDGQQLSEQMWDLVYGLLSTEESQALIARIKSDPDAARLYAEVRLQADLVAQAAKVNDPSLVLPPIAAMPVALKSAVQPSLPARQTKRDAHRLFNILAAAGATALVALLGAGLFWTPTAARPTAFVVDVLGDAAMPAGLSRALTIKTFVTDSRGDQQAAEPTNLELRLVNAKGIEVLRQSIATATNGEATIKIPGEALEPGVQLEVTASQAAQFNFTAKQTPAGATVARTLVRAPLPVEPEPKLAYLLCAEPTAQAGKPVDVSLWNFSAFSNRPASPDEVSAAAKELSGLTIEQPSIAQQQQGLLNAKLDVAPSSVTDPVAIDAAANVQQRQYAGGPRAALQQVEHLQRGALAEGKSELADQAAAGVPALQANGPRMAMRRAQAPASRAAEPRALEQRALNSAPRQSTSFGAVAQQLPRSEPAAADVTLPTIPSGQPIVVPLGSDTAGKSFLATAVCRGVTVATTVHDPAPATNISADAKKSQLPINELQLDLPPEADGVVDVFVFDRSQGEATLVSQQSFYREPLRKLNIALAGEKPRFLPGERVKLELHVTDEQGKSAPETLVGVRVWNELALAKSAEPPVLLEEALRGGIVEADAPQTVANPEAPSDGLAHQKKNQLQVTRNVQRSRAFESAQATQVTLPPVALQKRLSDADRSLLTSPAVAGIAAPIPSGGALADKSNNDEAELVQASPETATVTIPVPVVLASNQQQAQTAAADTARAIQQSRQQRLPAIGLTLLIGGVLLLAAIGISALRNAVPQAAILAPSLAAALAGIVLGFLWIGSPRAARQRTLAVGSAPEVGTTAESGSQRADFARVERERAETQLATENRDARGIAVAASGPAPAESAAKPATIPAAPTAASPLATPAGGGRGSIGGFAGGTPAAKDAEAIVAAPSDAQARESIGRPTADAFAAQPPQASPTPAIAAAEVTNPNPLRAAGVAGRAPIASQANAEDAAPASLYFNPQLATDSQGRANIEFIMPPVESEYRLLIDALGQGRVGSRQQQLIIGERQGAK